MIKFNRYLKKKTLELVIESFKINKMINTVYTWIKLKISLSL